ncbi:MAG TPA: helix-hairpin-helix domain-containing protein, partial [Phaeodactylibacter sp.]|nr:helix-hairpin-helix domain-containing protein [Phaeodactylibacter sp.]
MRKQFYEYLYLSRQERDGLFMMLFLSILISLLPLLFSFFTKKQATDFAPFIAEIESFNHAANISNSFALAKQPFEKTTPSTSKNNLAKPFFFDPNQATKNDFIQLGLSAKTAQTILNFRNKGAFFSKKEDFKKVYGLKNTDYERLVDFIQIKKNNFPKSKFSENKIPVSYDSPTIRPTAFDPNTASKKILVQNGIPPQVASTIIKYRNSGAVFHNKKDLKKIYSLSDAVYQKI